MLDRDIRNALHASFVIPGGNLDTPPLILDELGICGTARIDVAVIDDNLTGYEIKSSSDSLRRLPEQAEAYSRVLDYAVLIVAPRHVLRAEALVPKWWGSIEVSGEINSPLLTRRREPRPNPEPQPASIAQLLWRNEALDELVKRELDRGLHSKPRAQLWERLAREVPLDELRDIVRSRLRARTDWRPAPAQA